MGLVNLQYNEITNVVYIDAERAKFVPKYLYYLFQYHNIPTNCKVYFKGETSKDAKPLDINKNKEVKN